MPINKDTYLEFTVWVPDYCTSLGNSIAICGLCGNSGLIEGTVRCWEPKVYMSARPCICPNGRERIKRGLSPKPDIDALNTQPKTDNR